MKGGVELRVLGKARAGLVGWLAEVAGEAGMCMSGCRARLPGACECSPDPEPMHLSGCWTSALTRIYRRSSKSSPSALPKTMCLSGLGPT